jgi:site-specific recombinase XerD
MRVSSIRVSPALNQRRPGAWSKGEINREMVLRFRKWLIAQNYLPSTVTQYCKLCDGFCKFLGNRLLREVIPMDISDFITANLPSTWSDGLVNNRLAPLRSFFDFLYLGGAVDTVPPRFIHPRKETKKLPPVLTRAQVRKLLAKTRKPRDRVMLELLYATGCRVGEVLALRVSDLDFVQRKLRVKGKRKERMVYFGSAAAKAIGRYLKGRKNGYLLQHEFRPQRGHVHATTKTWVGEYSIYPNGRRVKISKYLGVIGKTSHAMAKARFARHLRNVDLRRPVPDRPLCKNVAWKMLTAAAHRVGLRFIPGRMLRHSCATHLWENGADIRVIQELLGHSYLSSTQIYVHISDDKVAETFRRLHPRGN